MSGKSIEKLLNGLTVSQLKEVKERSGISLPNVTRKADYVYWLNYCYEQRGMERIKDAAEQVMAE